jgi:hypothetical protein
MSTTELMDMINKLPADKQKEVENLVSSLLFETNAKMLNTFEKAKTDAGPKKRMEFGELKGLVTYIADDFDEPLEDFKEYM